MTLRHMKILVRGLPSEQRDQGCQALHLSQPSVKIWALRELEDYYGVTLFERGGTPISPHGMRPGTFAQLRRSWCR